MTHMPWDQPSYKPRAKKKKKKKTVRKKARKAKKKAKRAVRKKAPARKKARKAKKAKKKTKKKATPRKKAKAKKKAVRKKAPARKKAKKAASKRKASPQRELEDRALSLEGPATFTLAAYRKIMLRLKPILVYHPDSGDRITEASIKRHHKAAVAAAKPIKPSKCPKGWYEEGKAYVHPKHMVGIIDRNVQPLPTTAKIPGQILQDRFVVVTRNVTGRGRFKWFKGESFGTLRSALKHANSLAGKRTRMTTPRPELIVATEKQFAKIRKAGKAWFKFRGQDYWPIARGKDVIGALLGDKKKGRPVKFIRADSELDPRYGHGPGYVPMGPWEEAKKNAPGGEDPEWAQALGEGFRALGDDDPVEARIRRLPELYRPEDVARAEAERLVRQDRWDRDMAALEAMGKVYQPRRKDFPRGRRGDEAYSEAVAQDWAERLRRTEASAKRARLRAEQRRLQAARAEAAQRAPRERPPRKKARRRKKRRVPGRKKRKAPREVRVQIKRGFAPPQSRIDRLRRGGYIGPGGTV